jgi:hypothetical protein
MVRSPAQHLEALLQEKRLVAPQKANLQLCWAFLEAEIVRVRALEKARPTRSTPVKTLSSKSLPDRASKEKSLFRAGVDVVKRAVGGESKVQPAAKEDAVSPVEKATTPKRRWPLTSPLKAKNRDDAPAPEALSPASRLRKKKASLAAYSTAGSVDQKLRDEYRQKRIAQEDAATSKWELGDMAREEVSQKSRDFVCVGHDTVFVSKAKAYLRLQLFLNKRRDYMLVCTKAAKHETYLPVLVSESELARASTAYNKGTKPSMTQKDCNAEAWALHYLFKCGRVTVTDDRCEILGVDAFSLDDAVKSGNYSDAASFGAWEAVTLKEWQPAGAVGDKIVKAFDATVADAQGDLAANEAGRVVAEMHRKNMGKQVEELHQQHAVDAPMLDGLEHGYAPSQKHSKDGNAPAKKSERPRSRVKPAVPKVH